jgi:hypothetical protein
MAPVAPQDVRPKDLLYWESNNSEGYRAMWETAIQGGADWVQIITWNDYSEGTEIAPSSGTQWSFYDLTAYYTAWFKTGVQPVVNRDVLYYFHRRHTMAAKPSSARQTRPYTAAPGSDPAKDDIEALVFATATGTLRISVGARSTTHPVRPGINSVRVPMAPGTPVFELQRDGATALRLQSSFIVNDGITFQDLLYRSGSSSRTLFSPQ